jgi:hypothetical protein
MKTRTALKIVTCAAYGQRRHPASQIERALRTLWHTGRYPDGPSKGQRMRLTDTQVKAIAKVLYEAKHQTIRSFRKEAQV